MSDRDIEQMNESIEELIAIRDARTAARALKCACSGFVIQYQGCSCGRAGAGKLLDKRMDEALEALT
jgi:hypothetical protein